MIFVGRDRSSATPLISCYFHYTLDIEYLCFTRTLLLLKHVFLLLLLVLWTKVGLTPLTYTKRPNYWICLALFVLTDSRRYNSPNREMTLSTPGLFVKRGVELNSKICTKLTYVLFWFYYIFRNSCTSLHTKNTLFNIFWTFICKIAKLCELKCLPFMSSGGPYIELNRGAACKVKKKYALVQGGRNYRRAWSTPGQRKRDSFHLAAL